MGWGGNDAEWRGKRGVRKERRKKRKSARKGRASTYIGLFAHTKGREEKREETLEKAGKAAK